MRRPKSLTEIYSETIPNSIVEKVLFALVQRWHISNYCPDINIEDNYSKMLRLEKIGFTWGTLNYIMIKVLCAFM